MGALIRMTKLQLLESNNIVKLGTLKLGTFKLGIIKDAILNNPRYFYPSVS